MPKEMVVSASSHETKIAILEDGQVVEVYFEREKAYGLAGSICKGRVTRILPGMQSAFVNIGLERDAFLYVSDFFEDIEEYDRILTTVEERVSTLEGGLNGESVEAASGSTSRPTGEEAPWERAEPLPSRTGMDVVPASEKTGVQKEKSRRFSRRSRRHRQSHRGFPDSKYARRTAPGSPQTPAPEITEPRPAPVILPGESLAKYRDRMAPSAPPKAEAAEMAPEGRAAPAKERAEARTLAAQQPVWESVHAVERGSVSETSRETIAETQAPRSDFPKEETLDTVSAEEPAGPIEVEESVEPDAPLSEVPVSAALPEEQPTPEPLGQPLQESLPPAESPAVDSPGVEAGMLTQPGASESARMVPEAPEEGKSPEGSGTPREAIVREGPRNPRYLRKPRWLARKEARGEEARPPRARTGGRETPKPLIGDLLKEGQEIIVQVAKEPLGKKGARITSHIALPGRYLVYMPTLDHVGVSRKIASEEERQRLKRIILEHTRNLPGGFIVRTAGVGRSGEDFRQDIVFLANLWAEIKAKAEKVTAPALLHHDLDLVLRTLRDQLSEEFATIWVDNEQEYEEILGLVQKFQPALVNRIRLYTKDVPLFEETGVQEEIHKALKPKVWLKSGGYIVINQTEALVAIDVNTGKFVGKSNRLEDTIVKTNVEAIQEIVRQIRLRDLGGIIVIDFIDMDERKNRQKVMSALEEALKADRSPSKILAFNEFGLVAITRKRVRQSLERTLCQPCSYCGSSGLVKSATTVCLEILTEARKMASALARRQITLRVNPEVGKALKSSDHAVLPAIEEITGKGVIIRNDPALHIEDFYFD